MDCCDTQRTQSWTSACPECGGEGQAVKIRTLKHWLATVLVHHIPDVPFHFCAARDCPIVYFSEAPPVRYAEEQIRYKVGIKGISGPIQICYCFGVTDEMVLEEIETTGKSSFSRWVGAETKAGNCACDVRNPSGRCCLTEVKKVESRSRAQ